MADYIFVAGHGESEGGAPSIGASQGSDHLVICSAGANRLVSHADSPCPHKLQILLSVRAHRVYDAVERFALAGELVFHLWRVRFELLAGDQFFFFEHLELIAKGARGDTGERCLEFTEAARLYQKVSHNEDAKRVAKQISRLCDGAVLADFLALLSSSEHETTVSWSYPLYKVK